MSTTTDASVVPFSEPVADQEELIPVSELAHQCRKSPVTIMRLLPADFVVRVGRTPWVPAARSRAILFKRSNPA